MQISEAIMIAEGVTPADEPTQKTAWQLLIDTGVCWELQGWFGRNAMMLIDSGICHRPGDPVELVDPEFCDCCECTPCDCNWGTDQ